MTRFVTECADDAGVDTVILWHEADRTTNRSNKSGILEFKGFITVFYKMLNAKSINKFRKRMNPFYMGSYKLNANLILQAMPQAFLFHRIQELLCVRSGTN